MYKAFEGADVRRFSEFFGVSDDGIEVEYSRYRFALADRPDMAER